MGYPSSVPTDQLSVAEARMLHAAYSVCIEAQQFFREAAAQINNSNLRYKFLQLAKMHCKAAQRLPAADCEALTVPEYNSELAAVQFWYLHQATALSEPSLQQPILTELAGLLQQQLRVLRQLATLLHNNEARVVLAQLAAELQISSDQLQPLLKVLPPNGQ
ncbi:hypothetical protein [Rheinheimera sp. NSM]|uniref:hypothetical protein n=1 Tax=Rheinheimera sp. NSM TaxID=3457884 RepID=UPI0040373BD9